MLEFINRSQSGIKLMLPQYYVCKSHEIGLESCFLPAKFAEEF